MFRIDEDNHHNGRGLERRGTARPSTVTKTRSRPHHQGEASARPVVANDAAFGSRERGRRPPSPGVASSNKRNKRNKTKRRKRRKNCRND